MYLYEANIYIQFVAVAETHSLLMLYARRCGPKCGVANGKPIIWWTVDQILHVTPEIVHTKASQKAGLMIESSTLMILS